ncbi:hypothetical protein BGZ96_010382 [Linnemannia gamsii]|uniref:Uncharacterized protein n=1 Tax=Linnemannia gamsii TaxID=64522 RepID=A0ABQ7JUT5_9FUNG|nr:hypothetical protein BGZ96_010382 [Linnemannia gamsii]
MAETPTPSPTAKGPVGGHMTKKQRKEQFEALGALQTQLDVSVSLARSTVASWLNPEGFSDDDDTPASNSGFVGSAAIKPRQPGLGLGAKYLSHKDQMRHVPLNAFESKLKRQLTGGVVGAELARADAAEKNALPDKYMEHKLMMAAKRKELQEQAEDEEDSRTRNITGSGSSIVGSRAGAGSGNSIAKAGGAGGASMVAASMGGLKKKNKEAKYQAAVHPVVLKAAAFAPAASGSSENAIATTPSSASSKPATSSGGNKKRPTDFFSTYMDERASKMAKKKKKSQGKVDPDDD